MKLGQEIKFKNGTYGNPKSLFVIYDLDDNNKHALPDRVIEVGYEGTYQYEKEVDIVLPRVATYESYRTVLKYLK